MDWKEFFRPTIGKVGISFVAGIIPLYKQTICPFVPPCLDNWIFVLSALNSFFYMGIFGPKGFIGKLQVYDNLVPDFVSYLLEYILSIFVIYLISCSVVYAYKKIKNK